MFAGEVRPTPSQGWPDENLAAGLQFERGGSGHDLHRITKCKLAWPLGNLAAPAHSPSDDFPHLGAEPGDHFGLLGKAVGGFRPVFAEVVKLAGRILRAGFDLRWFGEST